MRDKVARVLLAAIALCAISFASYAAFVSFTYEPPKEVAEPTALGGANTSVLAGKMDEYNHRNGLPALAFALTLASGLVAIYLPSSNQWFRGDGTAK